ncbi:MAG: UDP-glucose/GDP-mannose dehydrogenase family protein [Burkholderiaceae bacterium]|nr:MAG: UDP-glucose/GDP-mannose dehydrogenase family protein [Burkholderiaceae bacterium]
MMKVCVQGLWHLGSVTAACLASVGHDVTGLDAEPGVIDGLQNGSAPLFEPGLNDLLQAGISAGRLRFTTSVTEAIVGAEVLWVAFDTPVDDEDRADVEFVMAQIKSVLPTLADDTIVLVSSQMPVGSIQRLEAFARNDLPGKRLSFACSPENLRLGKALDVFLKPDRIIVGVRTLADRARLEGLLLPITNRIEWMSVESAEMTKHAINAFLATSVTFANEIAAVCELVGADAKEVERGLKSEMRIGPKAYLSPGGPFAGGTLARDIEFLGAESRANHLLTPLLSSIRASNDEHKNWTRRKLLDQRGDLHAMAIAVWGLTYKPGTDTLRRSLAVELCDWLIGQGAIVHVYDPVVRQLPERWLGKVASYVHALDAVVGADALVVGTEWPEFRTEAVGLRAVANPGLVIIDANRHLYAALSDSGLKYVAVGTPMLKVE